MSRVNGNRSDFSTDRLMAGFLCALAALAWCGATANAQTARVVSRPLSHQEIHDFGLTNTTQISGGLNTVGVGQPAYLEIQVQKEVGEDPAVPVIVTQFVWSVDSAPPGSTASLTNSPLADTNAIPIYSRLDQQAYSVVSRQLFVPDKAGAYTISAQIGGTTSGVPISVSDSYTLNGGDYKTWSDCNACHGPGNFMGAEDKITPWQGTGHSDFFTRSIDGETSTHYNSGCVDCHTLGYDETPAADNAGFDDVADLLNWTFPTNLVAGNWDDMPAQLQDKANIQCENCHGPASGHTGGGFANPVNRGISVTVSAGDCAQCHDEQPYHLKNQEWDNSLHAKAYFRNSDSCLPCHSSHGFIDSVDGDGKTTSGTGGEGISCTACHDPHSAEGPHQLRPVTNTVLGNGVTVDVGGRGLLCMQCHKGRRDTETYVYDPLNPDDDQLGDPSSHFGPHHGPQADMMAAGNAYLFGQEIASSDHLGAVDDACVQCHMQDLAGSPFASAAHEAGGHTFSMTWDAGTPTNMTDDVDISVSCAECHGEIDSFDVGGTDHNQDGVIDGVQTEIGNLMDQLGMLLPPVGSPELDLGQLTTNTDAQAEIELMAAFNYEFVHEDGSHGVHNP